MRKFFVILAIFAFTFNVNAAEWDFTIAEGEAVDVERAIAVQFNVNTNLWDYILKGNTLRVYIHHLQDDTRTNIPYHSYRINYHLNERNDVYGHYWIYTYSLTDNSFSGSAKGIYNRLIADMERTYNVKNPGPYSSPQAASNGTDIAIDIIDSNDIIIDEDENGEYLRFSDDDNLNGVGQVYFSDDSPTRLSKVAKSLTASSMKTALLGSASIPLNDVRITITNEAGQATSQFDTNIVVKLDQILQQVTRIKNDTSTIVSELMFLANAFGFDGSVGSSTSNLAEFLGQWRTADGVWQAEILDSFTNSVDYTDYLKYYIMTSNPTNIDGLVWIYNQLSRSPSSWGTSYDGFIRRSDLNKLLGSTYVSAMTSLINDFRNSFYNGNNSLAASSFALQLRDMLWSQGVDWTRYQQTTNIINGIDLGRDWLNLATNDISSLPYWLNQQDYSSIGGTNGTSFTRFDVITNQYAHIGLTGSGQQANSTETWNYFKRLEMLLAALVYKQTDYEGKIDPHESGNNASVSSSVATGEDQINTSLSAVKDALTLSTIGNAKNNIVSLFQTATSAFDVNGSKRVINVMETDVATGNESAGVTVNVDFTQGELGDFVDFVHHLFGFAWGFGSLFIFWRVCKFCWDMGYKVVKFHYSLCRKFLGI